MESRRPGKWLETPEGWAQANLLLATLREPPPRGSVQSYVLQALLIRKDQIEFLKVRALIQATVNKEAADKALSEYRDAQLPYLPKVQKDDRSMHIKKLMEEVGRGEMSITPVMQKRVKSKMRHKVVQRDEARNAQANRIAKKVGGLT